MWQRWPHAAALVMASLTLLVHRQRRGVLLMLAALAVLLSGAAGVFHAGVEYGLWESPLACTAVTIGTSGDFLADLAAAPVVRCDAAAWTLFGISLAGYNAIFSILIGGLSLWWLKRRA
jgi:disulfide bond formation protein DsbB